MMNCTIDTDRLRRDLEDYYGTAMFGISGIAVMDLSRVECASEQDLVEMAEKAGLDLHKYIVPLN